MIVCSVQLLQFHWIKITFEIYCRLLNSFFSIVARSDIVEIVTGDDIIEVDDDDYDDEEETIQ